MKDNGQLQAGRDSAERGKAAGAKTERERAYIAAVASLYSNFESTPQQARLLAYRDAMEALASKYSDDKEAQIFYALALAAAEEPTDKTYAARLKAGAILEKLFREEPDHPGVAHYIIHTYDVPPLAGRALQAARRYSAIAPDAPHALHMPSHTFTRVGYWQDSIDSNLAAAAASRREGQTAEELHALDYQAYAYLQTAQDEAVRRLVESLPEIALRFNPGIVISGAAPPTAGYFYLARIPARSSLERFEATLKREPNRFRALFGVARAAQLKGDGDTSRRYFRELLRVCEHADKPGRKELTEQLTGSQQLDQ